MENQLIFNELENIKLTLTCLLSILTMKELHEIGAVPDKEYMESVKNQSAAVSELIKSLKPRGENNRHDEEA